MESDMERYKRMADDAKNTCWALYAVGALLLIVTMGVAFPISFVLFGVGQCVFAAKSAKYFNLAVQHGYKPTGFWETPVFKDK